MSTCESGHPNDAAVRIRLSLVAEGGDPVGNALLSTGQAGQVLEDPSSCSSRVTPALREEIVHHLAGDFTGGLGEDHAHRRLATTLRRWESSDWSAEKLDLQLRKIHDFQDATGTRILLPHDHEWPDGLDDLGPARPYLLWVRSSSPRALQDLSTRPAVAVVGSRSPTEYGVRCARGLAEAMARQGVATVSGGAAGVDSEAHWSTLRSGGTTAAVFACGVDRYYPASNAALFQRLVNHGGMLISESPPQTTPTKWRFLQRNRIIAALAAATVVVEAARRSGALNTARHADELSRMVGVVPGSIFSPQSQGCHHLLRTSAAVLVSSAADVLELLEGVAGAHMPVGPPPEAGGSRPARPEELRVLDALVPEVPRAPDAIAREAKMGLAETQQVLGRLRLQGKVREFPHGWLAADNGNTP